MFIFLLLLLARTAYALQFLRELKSQFLEFLGEDTNPPAPIPIPDNLIAYLKYMGKLAILGYCSEIDINEGRLAILHQDDTRHLTHIRMGKLNSNAWITAYNSQTNSIVVSFRATKTLLNWKHNAEMKFTEIEGLDPNIKVHLGWYHDVYDLLPALTTEIQDLLDVYPSSDIQFTGHSSGASYATLSTFIYAKKSLFKRPVNTSRISLITFGSPRVGNIHFVKAFNALKLKASYRVFKTNDPVCYIPTERIGYFHVDREVFIEAKAGLKDKPPVFCDEQIFNLVEGSCFNRESFLENALNYRQVYPIHLNYLGNRLGPVQCALKRNSSLNFPVKKFGSSI